MPCLEAWVNSQHVFWGVFKHSSLLALLIGDPKGPLFNLASEDPQTNSYPINTLFKFSIQLSLTIFAEPSSCFNIVSTEKKMHNLKIENYVLFGRQNWGFKPGT